MNKSIEIEKEATEMAEEIWKKMKLPKSDIPTIGTKQGGYSAVCYYGEGDRSSKNCIIKVRENVWAKMLRAQKRLLLIHELVHAIGYDHSGLESFCASSDLLSVQIYDRIYGMDSYMAELKSKIDDMIDKMIGGPNVS